jgi:hypothetical protein
MNMLKKIARWIVPWEIYELAGSIKRECAERSRLSPEDKQILSQNDELKNKHAGQRCFILATGPSIKNQDLKPLKDELCISVSNFFMHPDYDLIRPRYHCIAPFHPPITEPAWNAWMRDVEARTAQAILFFALSDKARNSQLGMFAEREKHYLDFRGSWEDLQRNGVDLTMPTPAAQSVAIMALQVALFLGCNPIYLLGCDHDWILHMNESRHFYCEDQHALNRMGTSEWFGADFASYCQDCVELWNQYKRLRCIAESKHVMVANATAGGCLDVLPRASYEAVIAGL